MSKKRTKYFHQQGCTCEYSKVAIRRRSAKTVSNLDGFLVIHSQKWGFFVKLKAASLWLEKKKGFFLSILTCQTFRNTFLLEQLLTLSLLKRKSNNDSTRQ